MCNKVTTAVKVSSLCYLLVILLLSVSTPHSAVEGSSCHHPTNKPNIIKAIEKGVRSLVDGISSRTSTVSLQYTEDYHSSSQQNLPETHAQYVHDVYEAAQSSEFSEAAERQYTKQERLEGSITSSSSEQDNKFCTFLSKKIQALAEKIKDSSTILKNGGLIQLDVKSNAKVGLFDLLPISGKLPFIPLRRVSYNCKSFDFKLATRAYGPQTIIPNVISLRDIRIGLDVKLNKISSTLVIAFEGQWAIGKSKINMKVMYSSRSGELTLLAKPSGTRFDFVDLANDLTGLSLPNPFSNALSLDGIYINGVITSQGNTGLTLVHASGRNKVYIIYSKPRCGSSREAIAVEFSSFRFSSLVRKMTGLDISSVPYFGTFISPKIGLTISSDSIDGLPENFFKASRLLSLNGNGMEDGVTAYMDFRSLKEPLKITYKDDQFSFQPGKSGMRLGQFLAITGISLQKVPSGINRRKILGTNVKSFVLAPRSREKALEIHLPYPDQLKIFKNAAEVSEVSVSIYVSRSPTKVKIEVDCFVSILKISRKTSLRVTNSGYRFHIEGKFLQLFFASFDVFAPFSNISQAKFHVKGGFRNDLFKQIENKITTTLKKAANKATTAVYREQQNVKSKDIIFVRASKKMRGILERFKSKTTIHNLAVRKVKDARKRVENVCHFSRCGNVCVARTDESGKCYAFRKNGTCCKTVTDPKCKGKNAVCGDLKRATTRVLRAEEKNITKLRHSLNVVKAQLNLAKTAVTVAEKNLKVAVLAQKHAVGTYHVGIEAAAAILKYGTTGLVDIREILFDLDLSIASRGSFSAKFHIIFLKQKDVNLDLYINLRSLTSVAKNIASRIRSGFAKLF